MDMYFKSSTIWLLLVAVLLGSLVRSHENDAERNNSKTESRSLTDQPAIAYLNLSWEGLISVPVIGPGQLVYTLDLSHNNLHSLYNGNFYPYANVRKLILSSNNITSIESKTFSNLQSLTEVDLSYNSLTFIHPSMFVLNTNLQALSLQGNPLYTFESGTPFLIALSLRSLDLSHCHLLQFSIESLSGMPKLEILDLRQNNLQQLSVNNISALSSLKLTGNPWQCDCHFRDLLVWLSTNQMMDTDIRTDNAVQCWLGDKMRNLITKKDWDSICMEATGLHTSHKIIPELAVTSSKNDYAILDKKSDSAFPANNKDDDGDVWMFEVDSQEILYDYDDSEEMDEDISLSAGELRNPVHQDYTGLNVTVSSKVGDNHEELSMKYEVINSSTSANNKDDDGDVWMSEEILYFDYDSEELDANISLSAGELWNPVHQDYTGLNLTVSSKVGDNHEELSMKHEVINSSTYFLRSNRSFIFEPADFDSDGEYSSEFEDSDALDSDNISNLSAEIPGSEQEDGDLTVSVAISAEDPEYADLGFYDYEFYGEYQDSEELQNVSVAEIPGADNEDHNTPVDVNYSLENANLQGLHSKTKLPVSTTDFSSQGMDVVMDGIASDQNSLKIADIILTDDNGNVTLNYRLDFDYDTIPDTETQNLKHSNEYEFADSIVLLEVVKNAEDIDSSFQFQNIYGDFNPEDIGVSVAFDFDNLDSMEVNKYDPSSDTIRFPDTLDEDNFDVDNLIVSVLNGLNSAADVQERETLMNQNDKPPNERYLTVHIIIRFLILVGMVFVVVFLLLVIFYCITNVCYTSAFPMQVNEYKKLKNSISENELVQNV